MEQLSAQINSILSKFGTNASTVAINISSRSVIEVIEFDKEGKILNYANLPIQYNAFTKEIENIVDFESAVKRAFSELNISLSSKAYVSLPTFLLETKVIPAAVFEEDESSVELSLTAEAEKNYIFKKYDPAISYYKIPTTETPESVNVVYTALRKDEYSKILGVLESVGLKILAVDSSYSSLINGVIATQKINPNIINNNGNWNIIEITSNSFIIYAMTGKQLISVYEEPLAVKSFTEEEIYQVINNSLELVLDKYPAEQLVLVSQSDNVSAEYLASTLNIDTTKTFIEDNKLRRQLVDDLGYNITQSNKTKISLEAVGLVQWPYNADGFKFNFIGASGAEVSGGAVVPDSITVPWLNNRELIVTPQLIKKWVIAYFAIALIIAVLIAGVYYSAKNSVDKTQADLAAQIEQINSQLDKKETKPTAISVEAFLRNNYDNNVNYKKSYSSIAREIPDMLWIEEVQLSDDSKFYMKGRSYRMDDILNYYDSLSKLGKFPNLRISDLKISNEDVSLLLKSDMQQETTYEFVFGDQVYSNPNAVPVQEDADNKNANAKTGNQPAGVIAPPPAVGGTNTNVLPPAPTTIPKKDQ